MTKRTSVLRTMLLAATLVALAGMNILASRNEGITNTGAANRQVAANFTDVGKAAITNPMALKKALTVAINTKRDGTSTNTFDVGITNTGAANRQVAANFTDVGKAAITNPMALKKALTVAINTKRDGTSTNTFDVGITNTGARAPDNAAANTIMKTGGAVFKDVAGTSPNENGVLKTLDVAINKTAAMTASNQMAATTAS